MPIFSMKAQEFRYLYILPKIGYAIDYWYD